jgi:hypothetical protein
MDVYPLPLPDCKDVPAVTRKCWKRHFLCAPCRVGGKYAISFSRISFFLMKWDMCVTLFDKIESIDYLSTPLVNNLIVSRCWLILIKLVNTMRFTSKTRIWNSWNFCV